MTDEPKETEDGELPESREDDLNRRLLQQSHNVTWLSTKFDELHDLLCPGQVGTWQQRVEQVLEAVKKSMRAPISDDEVISLFLTTRPSFEQLKVMTYYDEAERRTKPKFELRQLVELAAGLFDNQVKDAMRDLPKTGKDVESIVQEWRSSP